MRLTVLQQTAKGLPDQTRDEEQDYPLRDPVVRDLERLKWYLWHGNVYKALQVVQSVEMDPDAAVATSGHGTARKLLKAVEEFHTYIENNKELHSQLWRALPAGGAHQHGLCGIDVNQVISKRFCKKQQMAWTTRGPSAPTDPDAGVKWGLGSDIPGVVSGVPCLPSTNGSVTPTIQTLFKAGCGFFMVFDEGTPAFVHHSRPGGSCHGSWNRQMV